MNLAENDNAFAGCTVCVPKQCENCKYRLKRPYIGEDGKVEFDVGWKKSMCQQFTGDAGNYKPIKIMDNEMECPFFMDE